MEEKWFRCEIVIVCFRIRIRISSFFIEFLLLSFGGIVLFFGFKFVERFVFFCFVLGKGFEAFAGSVRVVGCERVCGVGRGSEGRAWVIDLEVLFLSCEVFFFFCLFGR